MINRRQFMTAVALAIPTSWIDTRGLRSEYHLLLNGRYYRGSFEGTDSAQQARDAINYLNYLKESK